MKKKIIKSLIFVLVVFQILMTTSPSFAMGTEVGEEVLIYVPKKIEGITMSYWGQEVIPYYTEYTNKNNETYVAYCVDYYKAGATDNRSYNVKITEDYVNKDMDMSIEDNKRRLGVWRAIINGYPFVDYETLKCANIYEAYAATKQAVFCMIENRDLSLYKYSGEAGTRVYNAMVTIINNAKASEKVPTNTVINLEETKWQIDEINNKYLSKKITLNCDTPISEFNVNLEGNIPTGTIITDLKNNELIHFKNCKEFKILVPLNNLTNNNEFTVNVQGNVNSYPMYYGKEPTSRYQSYVLTGGIIKQESAGSIIEYPENKTKVIIKKQDSEGKVLAGVKFNVLDEDKNIVYENLETNEYGIIEINNMIPGTYYLQEVETIEGYEFDSEPIELKIDLNEEKEIIVENTKIPEEPEEPEIPEEPETPEIPEIPETPETPTPEPPKLPRTGW